MASHLLRLLLLVIAILATASAPMMAQAVDEGVTEQGQVPDQTGEDQPINPEVNQSDTEPQQGDQQTDAGSDSQLPTFQGPQQLRLGFMLPFPFGDSAIPPRLADEWLSTAKMALTLLASKYEGLFNVEYYVTNSNCSRDSAELAARSLVADGVHAVVGPVCSESVIGANIVLKVYDIPFISFAATADIFSSGIFKTFFRTAFPDAYQGKAIAAVVKQYGLQQLYLFYSNETYGNGLRNSIASALAFFRMDVPLINITVPHPPPQSDEDYKALFNLVVEATPETGVILATSPAVTLRLLQTALSLKKVEYPWWYLGTDGATAFDLVGAGQSLGDLAEAIQGEIGVAPYDGVSDEGVPEGQFAQFVEFWSQQPYTTYPGLLTLPTTPRITRPRSYVVNLIDAIWTFHEVARTIVTSKHVISRATMLACMQGKPPFVGQKMKFQGASGWVQYNLTSGDRLVHPEEVDSPALYNVENLVGLTWQVMGSWRSGQTTSLGGLKVLEVTRPGPIPAGASAIPNTTEAADFTAPDDLLDASMEPMDELTGEASTGTTGVVYVNNGGISTGTLIALILLSTLLALTAIGGIIAWLRTRRRDHQAYGRMI